MLTLWTEAGHSGPCCIRAAVGHAEVGCSIESGDALHHGELSRLEFLKRNRICLFTFFFFRVALI